VPAVEIIGQVLKKVPLIVHRFRPKFPQVVVCVADRDLGL